MTVNTPWLDELIRRVHVGLLLRALSKQLSIADGQTCEGKLNNRLESVVTLMCGDQRRSDQRGNFEHVGRVAEEFEDAWPPLPLPSVEELAGLNERIRYQFAISVSKFIDNPNVSKKAVKLNALVEAVFKEAVRKVLTKDLKPQIKHAELSSFVKTIPAMMSSGEDSSICVEQWIDQADAIVRWRSLSRDVANAEALTSWANEVGLRIADLRKWLEFFQDAAQNAEKGEGLLAKVSRSVVGHKDDPTAGAFTDAANICSQEIERWNEVRCQLVPAFDEQRAATISGIVQAVTRILERDATWPPVLLANFADSMANELRCEGSLWERLRESQNNDLLLNQVKDRDLPCEHHERTGLVARFALLLKLTQVIDDSAGDGSEFKTREKLQEFGNALLADASVRLRLLWDHSDSHDPEHMNLEITNTMSPPVVLQTGVLIKFPRYSEQVLQRAKLRRPQSISNVVPLLRDFRAWLRIRSGWDDVLDKCCHSAIQVFSKHESLAIWWDAERDSNSETDGRSLLWKLMERLTIIAECEHSSPAVSVLEELQIAGVHWEENEWNRESGQVPSADEQHAVILSCLPIGAMTGGPQPAGLKLRTLVAPNGDRLAPQFCLAAPKSWFENRPLARCLAGCEPLRQRLQHATLDWTGWRTWNDMVVDEVYERIPGDGHPADVGRTVEALTAVYERGHDPTDTTIRHLFLELARRLYRCAVEEMGAAIIPRLNVDSLEPNRLSWQDLSQVDVQWTLSKEPVGSVLQIQRFGSGRIKARVQASLGPEFPDGLLGLMRLPRFRRDAVPDPVCDLELRIQQLPWDCDQATEHCKISLRQFQDWLQSAPGEEWLTQSMCELHRDEAPANGTWKAWYSHFAATQQVRIYPNLDLESGQIYWPTEESGDGPYLHWEPSHEVPMGVLIGNEVAFSGSAARAKGRFSLGAPESDSPVFLANRLAQLAGDMAIASVQGAFRSLQTATRRHVEGQTNRDELQQVALRCLDEIKSAIPPDTKNDVCDGLLGTLRRWSQKIECEILPRVWEFSAECSSDQLQSDERLTEPPQFDEGLTSGVVVVQSFGLCDQSGTLIRPCRLRLSAGSSPVGYAELLKELQAVHLPPTEELARILQEWPEHRIRSSNAPRGDHPLLFPATREFFPAFWDQLNEQFQDEQPQIFDELKSRLAELLDKEFGLTMFFPRQWSEFPHDWIKPANRTSSLEPRIRKVLRPGLCDRRHELFRSALIELE